MVLGRTGAKSHYNELVTGVHYTVTKTSSVDTHPILGTFQGTINSSPTTETKDLKTKRNQKKTDNHIT